MSQQSESNSPPPLLRLRVTPDAERQVRAGHPWLFATSIRDQDRPGEPGDLAVIYDRNNRFLAIGILDPESPIRMRILQAGKPARIDFGWWRERLREAIRRREGLFDDRTTGFRWINGESDGWPGLVLDRYGATLVMKLYTQAWLPRLPELLRLFQEEFDAERLFLRLSRKVGEPAARRGYPSDGALLFGAAGDPKTVFLETGFKLEADVVSGQKTGFFLDQRENRRIVETLAADRAVLNAFSFSGAFSLYAARGGAAAVTDVDLSAHALAGSARNFELNAEIREVARCPHERVQADAFEWLPGLNRRFGLVILDPPSLAKKEAERPGAIRAYERLAGLGIGCLEHGGILLACSCSAHVSRDEFFEAVRRAATKSGRKCSVWKTAGHAPDHPATFPQAEYLKAIYLKFGQGYISAHK